MCGHREYVLSRYTWKECGVIKNKEKNICAKRCSIKIFRVYVKNAITVWTVFDGKM